MKTSWKLAVVVAAALPAAPAQAATYCVSDPQCPPGGIVMSSLKEATDTANASEETDLVRLGAGSFTVPTIAVRAGTRLEGAGRDETFLRGGEGQTGPLSLSGTGPAVSDLTVVLGDGNLSGIELSSGVIERVHVDGTALSTRTFGVHGGRGGTFRHGSIDMPLGVAASNGMSLEDSVVSAAVGFEEDDYGGEIRRTAITAEVGAVTHGRGITIADSTVRLVGAAPIGLRADGTRNLGVSTIEAHNVTIVGPGVARGVGVQAISDCANRHTAAAEIHGVAIANLKTHIQRIQSNFNPDECIETTVTVRRSAYDPTRVVSEGPGTLDAEPSIATDLKLVDLAGGDLRPRWDSPLIGAAGPSSTADIRGLPRVGAPDVGAYEYQFAAPVARIDVLPGSSFTFDGRGSTDFDGDQLSYAWSFSDGGTAQGPVAHHAFGPGRHTATLTVTDPTGRTGSTTVEVQGAEKKPDPTPASTPSPAPMVGPPPFANPAPQAARRRVRPAGIAVRARRVRGRGVRYRLSGRIKLRAGTDPARCAGGQIAVRVPTGPGRDRARFAAVGAGCRFSMLITLPKSSRGSWVRLYPLFRRAEGLTNVLGRITLRPR